MARCEKCFQHGFPIICINDEEGPDIRTAHTGDGSEIVLPGKISCCQIEPLLPILQKMLKPSTHASSRRTCLAQDCPWKNNAIRSWTE